MASPIFRVLYFTFSNLAVSFPKTDDAPVIKTVLFFLLSYLLINFFWIKQN